MSRCKKNIDSYYKRLVSRRHFRKIPRSYRLRRLGCKLCFHYVGGFYYRCNYCFSNPDPYFNRYCSHFCPKKFSSNFVQLTINFE